MRAAKQHDREDKPLDDDPFADEVDALEEEETAIDDLSEDEASFELDAETQGLINKLYYQDEDDEDEDL
ncbi:hypothetical protein ACW9KT_22205 [Hymenobacter sp. HD11105]